MRATASAGVVDAEPQHEKVLNEDHGNWHNVGRPSPHRRKEAGCAETRTPASNPYPVALVPTTDDDESDYDETTNAASGDGKGATKHNSFWSDTSLTIRHFAALPPQLLLVLTLEFLNTFRVWGFYFVIYDYATNEFDLSDSAAGTILGVKGMLDVAIGVLGSLLVDRYGVRRISVFALGVAVVGRTLLSFGRTRGSLYLALFLFSPVGESLLDTGLYSVALKKLTTPRTRTVAFSVTYATRNLSGAAADVLIGLMRQRPDTLFRGKVFTPTRKFLIVTLVTVAASFVLALLWLQDLTVVDLEDPEDGIDVPEDAIHARAMCPCLLGSGSSVSGNGGNMKLFKTQAVPYSTATEVEMTTVDDSFGNEEGVGENIHNENEGKDKNSAGQRHSSSAINANVVADTSDENCRGTTPPTSSDGNSPFATLRWSARHVRDILRLRSARRVLLFSLVAFPIGFQWEAAYIALPAFLERTYGEGAPIYSVQSINMWGCLLLPPVVGTLTTAADLEAFRVIMPGLWVMALAPLALAVSSNVAGAVVWEVFMTIGEVVWAPQFQSWTASLAPVGKEGLFFSVGGARFFLSPLADWILGQWNEWYVPNCEECRDSYGHFCKNAMVNDSDADSSGVGVRMCASAEESCGAIPWVDLDDIQACPSTCHECPGWESNSTRLWLLVLASSLVTPVLAWMLLPFFRDGEGLKNVCSLGRFLGRHGKEYESTHNDEYDAGRAPTASASAAANLHQRRHHQSSYEKVIGGNDDGSNFHSNGLSAEEYVEADNDGGRLELT